MQCSLLLSNPTFVLIGFKAANFQNFIWFLSDLMGFPWRLWKTRLIPLFDSDEIFQFQKVCPDGWNRMNPMAASLWQPRWNPLLIDPLTSIYRWPCDVQSDLDQHTNDQRSSSLEFVSDCLYSCDLMAQPPKRNRASKKEFWRQFSLDKTMDNINNIYKLELSKRYFWW